MTSKANTTTMWSHRGLQERNGQGRAFSQSARRGRQDRGLEVIGWEGLNICMADRTLSLMCALCALIAVSCLHTPSCLSLYGMPMIMSNQTRNCTPPGIIFEHTVATHRTSSSEMRHQTTARLMGSYFVPSTLLTCDRRPIRDVTTPTKPRMPSSRLWYPSVPAGSKMSSESCSSCVRTADCCLMPS